METLEIKQELIKRYKYLYENKEVILALFIEAKIQTKTYKAKLRKTKQTKKDAKRLKQEELYPIIDNCISYYKKALKTPKYYLMDKITDDDIEILEEFLFTDYDIEDTLLYRMTEYLKCDELYLKEANNKIQEIQERRNKNKILKDKEFITVWRILNYVRDKNKDNLTYIKALDKYYNIERYIKTGINWNSGYIMLESDVKEYINLEEDYNNSKNNKEFICIEIIPNYLTNEFEQEDDYFIFEWLNEEELKPISSYSSFMNGLNLIQNLTEQEKQQLYLELKPKSKTKMKKI